MPISPGFKVMWLLISDVITIFSEVMAWGWNVLKIMPLHIFYFSPSLIPYSSSHHAEKWFTVRLKHWQWYCDFEIFEWFTGLFFFFSPDVFSLFPSPHIFHLPFFLLQTGNQLRAKKVHKRTQKMSNLQHFWFSKA